MNTQHWGGITVWGISVMYFGIGAFIPTAFAANVAPFAAPDQEDIFLLTTGIVVCLIGLFGMIGSFKQTPELIK